MATRICMNTLCGATVSSTWKKGWDLKSGQIADLCLNCGSAYEKLGYCDTFHSEETGWRECSLCNKRLHCGCSASLPFIEIQDFGGVWCINCAHSAGCHKNLIDALPSETPKQNSFTSCEKQNPQSSYKMDGDSQNDGSLLNLGTPSNRMIFGLQVEMKSPNDFARKAFENLSQTVIEPPKLAMPSNDQPKVGMKDMQGSQILPSLNISLGTPDSKSFSLALPGTEEGEKGRSPIVQSIQKARHIFPKPVKTSLSKSSSQKRIGRPPAEARLRNQLLPRYWPRITDQELQKLSGDLNSTIVPLFEKVLSASDASRIGRLVLPKACAEAYFPPINQSEGLPVKVQDVKGNEWTFQFRFWPNNNSRMYVLEGVTPCMQTLQLYAGDTVTFSRIDPGGKLVIGSRKALNSFETQDQQTPAPHNGLVPEENFYSDANDSQANVNGYRGLLHSFEASKENILNVSSGDIGWSKNENSKSKMSLELLRQPKVCSETKALNISSKNKRLLIHSEDAVELKSNWGDSQLLLRPPPGVQPTIFVVEGVEFEEYDVPPVFGKQTLFTTGLLGGQNQWAQCDTCAKWRKLPWDVLLPPKWSCLDNVWDLSRSSCSEPEEISSEELDHFLRLGKDSKKRKVVERSDAVQESTPSGLDALANAAVLGDQARESAEPSTGATTRHPRHRPGCSCIVCIQPPSGKGKHEASCSCNVCSTVKRRFKTLMMRKKKRKCEQEADRVQRRSQNTNQEQHRPTEESEPSNLPKLPKDNSKSEVGKEVVVEESKSYSKGIIDLNSRPAREDETQVEVPEAVTLLNLPQTTTIPLETDANHHTKEDETSSRLYHKKASPSDLPSAHPQTKKEGENTQNPPPKHETEKKDGLSSAQPESKKEGEQPQLGPELENGVSSTAVDKHEKKDSQSALS